MCGQSNPKVIQDKGGVFPCVVESNPKVIQDKGGFSLCGQNNPKVIQDKGGFFLVWSQDKRSKKGSEVSST